MKLTVAWNVWNNYSDTLLASEILRLQNEESKCFESLYLISQGGYSETPSPEEAEYLDGHFFISILKDREILKNHPKWISAYRILYGLLNAFRYANEKMCDYLLFTNGDAWCLDINKLKKLLERNDLRKSAVSLRVGGQIGLDFNFGEYVPICDEHYLIINLKKCREHGISISDEPKAYDALFKAWGGIHYILMPLIDELVPPGLFNIYTNLKNCVNHYGEKSGQSLLPWQYDPEFGFLHANCAQDEFLHPLRAAFLKHLELDKYPAAKLYCEKYLSKATHIRYTKDYVYFRKGLKQKLTIAITFNVMRLYHRLLYWLKYRKFAERKKKLFGYVQSSTEHYFAFDHVLPVSLVGRRTGAT